MAQLYHPWTGKEPLYKGRHRLLSLPARPAGYGPHSGAHMARGFQQGQGRFANGQPVVYRENPAEVCAAVAHSEAAARSQAEERDRRLREAQAAEDAFVKIAMQVKSN